MDKNKQLIQLSERGRFWRVPFDELSPPEQVFRAVWDLEADVNNGGFDQYFFNDSGDTAFAVVGALEAIGAHRAARIAAAANALFPGSTPPRDRDERQAQLDALEEKNKAVLEDLDQEFYRYPDNLIELLHDYVKRNAASIWGAADLGF